MPCSECGAEAPDSAWFCPACGHQLQADDEIDAIAAGILARTAAIDAPDHDTIVDDVSSTIAWSGEHTFTGEALIVGDISGLSSSEEDVDAFVGAVTDEAGAPSAYLMYAERTATRSLSPDACPRRTGDVKDANLTPYEAFLLERVDGRTNVADLQRGSGLAPDEVMVSLLTLLERGLLMMEAASPVPSLDRAKVTRRAPPRVKVEAQDDDASDNAERALRRRKAEQLFEAALADERAANIVSARMNLKLAIAFAPDEPRYAAKFGALEDRPADGAPLPVHIAARRLFEEAQQREAKGDIDGAVMLLERACKFSEEAMILNRLGVVLALRKRDFSRATSLLERATQLAPGNAVYTHNLSKVLAAAATQASAPAKRTGFWAKLFGRRS